MKICWRGQFEKPSKVNFIYQGTPCPPSIKTGLYGLYVVSTLKMMSVNGVLTFVNEIITMKVIFVNNILSVKMIFVNRHDFSNRTGENFFEGVDFKAVLKTWIFA